MTKYLIMILRTQLSLKHAQKENLLKNDEAINWEIWHL